MIRISVYLICLVLSHAEWLCLTIACSPLEEIAALYICLIRVRLSSARLFGVTDSSLRRLDVRTTRRWDDSTLGRFGVETIRRGKV